MGTHLGVLGQLLLELGGAGVARLELVQHAVLVRLPQRLVPPPALRVLVDAADGLLDGLVELQHGLNDLRMGTMHTCGHGQAQPGINAPQHRYRLVAFQPTAAGALEGYTMPWHQIEAAAGGWDD